MSLGSGYVIALFEQLLQLFAKFILNQSLGSASDSLLRQHLNGASIESWLSQRPADWYV